MRRDIKVVRRCPPGLRTYTIKKGDTFYKLAKKFNTTVRAIRRANPTINPERLTEGDKICIPIQENFPPCPNGRYYFVRPGDTLYNIAQIFNISLSAIINANNNINPNSLRVGQAICIPSRVIKYCPRGTTSYTIKPNDNLYLISQRFGVTIEEIMMINEDINPYNIRVGQSICIPIKWKLYFSQKYNVLFRYPNTWEKKVDQEPYQPIRYEGRGGYFEINAIATNPSKPWDVTPIEEICNQYAYGQYNPYGTNPTIERTRIDGEEACYILPSDDQPEDLKGRAALILRYPKFIYLPNIPYPYLLMYSDEKYIKAIGSTVRFINKSKKITKREAEILVRTYLGLTNNKEVIVEYDHSEGERYVIHVYDIVNNHTATRGWYFVDSQSGKIEEMFE